MGKGNGGCFILARLGRLPWEQLTIVDTMANIPKRNVHVFNSANGAEVAGQFDAKFICILTNTMSGFFQHGGVSISTFIGWINEVCYISVEWALYPSKQSRYRWPGT